MSEVDDILQHCYQDSKFLAKVLFEDRFSRNFDKEHDKIFDLLENSDNPRKLILAPRGIGKTTIDNLLIPAKKILFQEVNYIVPVGASAETAEEQSENLKNELLTNQSINALFDVQKGDTFSKNKWVIEVGGHKVCVRPRGAGQRIRGMLWEGQRPDLIIVDDLEDEESVKNELRREDLRKWFHGALVNTVDRSKGGWEIIVVGTLLHEDSLLMNLAEDPSWDHVILELCDDEYQTKFPNFMPSEEVKALASQYKESGELDVFYREYRNIPISTEDAAFRQEYFKYYDPGKIKLDRRPDIDNIVLLDIARTAKISSADSAIVGVAIDYRQNMIYVRDIVSGKMHPDEIYDNTIGMCNRLGARYLGVEVTGLNEFITYPLKNELFRRARTVELVELQARGGVNEPGKVSRIRSLVSFYRQGLVYHNSACTDVLEAQLLSFPRSKRWDVMDALSYAVEMLERGQRYMYSQSDQYEDPQAIEEEYEELQYDYEMPDNEDFRII